MAQEGDPHPIDPLALGVLLTSVAESIYSTLDPGSRKALLDDIRRRVHDPGLLLVLHPEQRRDLEATEAGLRMAVAKVMGRELP